MHFVFRWACVPGESVRGLLLRRNAPKVGRPNFLVRTTEEATLTPRNVAESWLVRNGTLVRFDEYPDNAVLADHMGRQVYIRAGERIEARRVFAKLQAFRVAVREAAPKVKGEVGRDYIETWLKAHATPEEQAEALARVQGPVKCHAPIVNVNSDPYGELFA